MVSCRNELWVTEDTGIFWTSESSGAEGTLSDTAESAAQFTNTYHPLTYFEKNVLYATSGTNADDTFTFEMYLNGELAGNIPIISWILRYLWIRIKTILNTLTTDTNGRFTLKPDSASVSYKTWGRTSLQRQA